MVGPEVSPEQSCTLGRREDVSSVVCMSVPGIPQGQPSYQRALDRYDVPKLVS